MTDETILNALRSRRGEFLSGEELSRAAGVSRTAIWKEVEKLRAEGYKILAQPHSGYQLVAVPDRLTAQELRWNLETQRIGRRIHAYEATDSTMDVAHRLAAAGEPEGSVVVAEAQGRGRGRMGRTWISPKGKGIYLSVIVRPELQLREIPQITLVAAVAAARAVESETGLKPEIKWPNDLLLGGKKIAGILTELSAELNRVNYVVIGIGLNVNTPADRLPAHGTSLAERLGERVDRLRLARGLLAQLDRAYAQFLDGGMAQILESWRQFAGFLGRRVRVSLEGRMLDGQALDVDPTGALLVRTDTGLVESVSAGEVLVVR